MPQGKSLPVNPNLPDRITRPPQEGGAMPTTQGAADTWFKCPRKPQQGLDGDTAKWDDGI